MPEEVATKINFTGDVFKKYLKNTSWMMAEKIIRLFVTFFVGIWLVRYLGPDRFGVLAYAISFVGLFSALSAFGLDNIITRELVNTPEKKDLILGSSFGLRIIGTLLGFVAILIAVVLNKEDSYNSTMILIIALGSTLQAFGTVEYYFQSLVQSKYNVAVQFSTLIIAGIAKVVLILVKADLVFFTTVFGAEALITSVGFGIAYHLKGGKLLSWKFSPAYSIQLLKDSWPLILSGLVVSIYIRIDQVMIKNMMTSTDLGYYAAAVRLCEAWYFVPMAVSSSLFPAVLSGKQISELVYHSRLQKLYDVLAWISIAIAVPVTLFPGLIIKIFLGSKFMAASPVLVAYIWAGVGTFLGVASSQYLVAENLTKLSFYRTLLGMVLNVVLNYLLIPSYGITGSAVATLISYNIATFGIALQKKTAFQFIMMMRAILFIDLFILVYKKWQSLSAKK